jgi:hypothetical protein
MTLAFDVYGKSRHFQYPHTPILVREPISGLNCSSLSLRPVDLLASLVGTDQADPSQPRLLLPGFRRIDHSHRRRISLRWQLGKFHRRDSHPLEQQLASLHPYGGFSPVRLQGRTIRRSLPSTLVCHRLSCSLLPSEFPALCQGRCAYKHLRASGQAALPQGPSLRSGLFCPGPSTLIRPHPPHSRAHPDFAVWRLIRDAFAVHIRICLGDPRLVLSFH